MSDIKSLLETKRMVIESYLDKLPRGEKNLLTESMAYSLQCGGKRLRPALFLITAELYKAETEPLLPFAAGIEMIHTYSLIHDDLPAMDNDDYRRGKPTNHKVYGEAQAILAGDGLLTEAFYMMTRAGAAAPAEKVLRAIGVASDLAGINGMVRGQTFDIEGEGKPLTHEALRNIHKDKTGALIRLSLITAAILCGGTEEDLKCLDRYGHYLGLSFQIVDDILDHEGTFESLGKPIGSDEENHKTTYISLLGFEGAKGAAKEATDKAIEALSGLSVEKAVLCELAEMILYRKK